MAAEQRWNGNFEKVRRFRVEHGRWPKQREGALGTWCGNQRQAKKGHGHNKKIADMHYLEAPPAVGGNFNVKCYQKNDYTFMADAQTLSTIATATYDFVITSHVLEHMRDVLGAIYHWLRVVRPGGLSRHRHSNRRPVPLAAAL